MMQMAGSFTEFEHAMLRERQMNVLAAARQDGRFGGRCQKLTPQQQKILSCSSHQGKKKVLMPPACSRLPFNRGASSRQIPELDREINLCDPRRKHTEKQPER